MCIYLGLYLIWSLFILKVIHLWLLHIWEVFSCYFFEYSFSLMFSIWTFLLFLDFNEECWVFSYSPKVLWGCVNLFSLFSVLYKLSKFHCCVSSYLILFSVLSIFQLSPLIEVLNFGYCIFHFYNFHLVFFIASISYAEIC